MHSNNSINVAGDLSPDLFPTLSGLQHLHVQLIVCFVFECMCAACACETTSEHPWSLHTIRLFILALRNTKATVFLFPLGTETSAGALQYHEILRKKGRRQDRKLNVFFPVQQEGRLKTKKGQRDSFTRKRSELSKSISPSALSSHTCKMHVC